MRHCRMGGADYLLGSDITPPHDTDGRSTEQQRSKDLTDALNWLRNKGDDDEKYDPTGEFRKLDSMLPKKRGQSAEDRAIEIEGSLQWLRNNRDPPSDDDA